MTGNFFLENRAGWIEATMEFVSSAPDALLVVFRRFLPLGVTHDPRRGTCWFFGFCPDFEPLPEGSKTPVYQVIFGIDLDTTVARFEKCDSAMMGPAVADGIFSLRSVPHGDQVDLLRNYGQSGIEPIRMTALEAMALGHGLLQHGVEAWQRLQATQPSTQS